LFGRSYENKFPEQLGDDLHIGLGSTPSIAHSISREWAHRDFVDCPRFVHRFGGAHESANSVSNYDPARHITRYAATMPCED